MASSCVAAPEDMFNATMVEVEGETPPPPPQPAEASLRGGGSALAAVE